MEHDTITDRWLRGLLFAGWLALVVFMSADHAVWRDEMRALSFAIQGTDLAEMLRRLHGEGHPALWYLLLRGAYTVWHDTVVLKVVAGLVGALSAAVLLWWSPFRLWLVAVMLFGKFMLFEFSVMARNYGISMLVMFVLAAAYARHRERGVVLGVLLFLLANTNVGSTLLVAGFLLFWLIETVRKHGLRWTPALGHFALNAGIAVAGVAVCAAQVYPPFNDAAAVGADGVTPARLFAAIVRPASNFAQSMLHQPIGAFGVDFRRVPYPDAWKWLVSIVMFGSVLGLARRPAALVAALATLFATSLFFTIVYGGQYRHQALWLVFLVALYWITLAARDDAPQVPRRTARLGYGLFVVVLLLQVPAGIGAVAAAIAHDPPFSRSRDLGDLVAADPSLRHAIVIADPDPILEGVPYYVDNPTYLLRQRSFGRYAIFAKKTRIELDVGEILATARALAAETRQPVLILLGHPLNPRAPSLVAEGYNWVLASTPAQVAEFLGATRLLANFGPAVSNETFAVYRLDPPRRTIPSG